MEFLDVFRGLYEHADELPLVHCYCFAKDSAALAELLPRAEAALGSPLDPALVWVKLDDDSLVFMAGMLGRRQVTLTHVRSVAPNKEMYCFSFRVPAAIGLKNAAATNAEPPSKRPCTTEA